MPTSKEIETTLQAQSADYLKRLETQGQLPTIVSDAWNRAGGAKTTELRGEEANLLTNYIGEGARARERAKDIWDPFVRDTAAANAQQNAYRPIAGIRAELASRAEALGVATQGAISMYSADTQKAGQAMGFTQDAYSRALQRETEQTRQRERAEEMAISASQGGGSGSGGKANSTDVTTAIGLLGNNDVQDWQIEQYIKAKPGSNTKPTTVDDAKKALGDKTLSASEFAKAVAAAMSYFGDKKTASEALKKAWNAGGYKQYGEYPLEW